MADAYPLCWPSGWQRTKNRRSSRFKTTVAIARDDLILELKRMQAKSIVISTNIELRNDGLPYSNRRTPADPGVAVYFTIKGKQQCIPCDRWDTVEDNLHAINLTVEALRGIERWGSGTMVDAAFSGFKALPAATITPLQWWQVLNVSSHAPMDEVTTAYRRQAMLNHPDRGGDVQVMQRINAAFEEFKRERGVA